MLHIFANPPEQPVSRPDQLKGFFILSGDIPAYAETGAYNHGLVLLSYIIVAIASYVALGIASKLSGHADRSQRIKLVCGAFAMGAGIWSMHFIGMLAYKMPMIVQYNPWITGLSMVVAVAFSASAFAVISRQRLSVKTLSASAPLLGLAVCGMHYLGMHAMVMDAQLFYIPGLFILSFLIAATAAAGALVLMYQARHSRHPLRDRILAAMVMAAAVCGMHYTGMAASVFLPFADCRYTTEQDFSGLAASIALITALIISIAYLVKELDEAMMEIGQRNAQLFQAQKMEAVGQLTGGIAHDFNNILGVILGNLELLKRLPSLPPRADVFIKTALESGWKARDLTHTLLAFSRKQVLQPVPTDLATLIPNALKLVERAVGVNINVFADIPGELPIVEIDPVKLESAILNLALNARDAMPDGGEIIIEAAAVSLAEKPAKKLELPPGNYAVISVRDTGAGMPPEILARAVEPFFTTKEVGQGSGMGLSMVFGFARQSGGNVTLHSAVGIGTTVTIYLPVLPGAAEGHSYAPAPLSDEIFMGTETVLVVDDQKELSQYLKDALDKAGYRVKAVTSGEDALKAMKKHGAVDVLVTDLLMPGINGYKLAELAYGICPRIKILFISGFAQRESLPDFLPKGTYSFLSKPFTLSSLTHSLRRLIDGQT